MMNTTSHASSPSTTLPLFVFGVAATLLPLVTTHTCLFLSLSQGHLEVCNPYWLSCHSISATGRHGAAYFVFKGGMIPAMVMLAGYWVVNAFWLRHLFMLERTSPPGRMTADERPKKTKGQKAKGQALLWLGPIASIALIVYTLSLGHVGDAFYILRRAGVVTYLGLTFIAQAIFSAALAKCHNMHIANDGKKLLRLCIFTLSLALFSLVLDALPMVDYKSMEDMFEWVLVLLLNLHGFMVVLLWRRYGVRLHLQS